MLGAAPITGGYGLYRWNGSTWITVPGGATSIAAGPNGNPWAVTSAHQIFASSTI